MLIDARTLEANAQLEADFCVIGSGMGGAAVAQKLASAGRDVLVIEAGGVDAALADGTQLVRSEHVGRSFNAPPTRCIELGGTSNQWHGICAPLDEVDFTARAWIRGSGWPLTLAQLAPYYTEAARMHEVPGAANFDTNTMAPTLKARLHDIEVDAEAARLKIMYYRKPPMRWKEALIAFARSQRLRCLVNAPALELVTNGDGTRVQHIAVGSGHRVQAVRARTFIVSCGALETPRLLLNSRKACAAGLGNEHDLVGRNLLDHPAGHFCKLGFHTRTLAPLFAAMSFDEKVSATVAVALRDEHQRLNSLPNHYLWIRPSVSPKRIDDELLLSFLAVRGPLDLNWKQVKSILTNRDLQYRILVHRFGMHPSYRFGDLYFTTEQLPNANSRIRLSEREKDRFGYPIAAIDWRLSSEDFEGFDRFARVLFAEGLRSDKYQMARIDTAEIWNRTVASTAHHMGTARMGTDPTMGVVDASLKVFGSSNLFVCDGSVLPTGGSTNPSLTITALAIRLSEHLLSRAN